MPAPLDSGLAPERLPERLFGFASILSIVSETRFARCDIYQDYTQGITTNTIWPGLCECSYYSNDLERFNEFAGCAYHVWKQVRNGITMALRAAAKRL